MLLVNRLKMNIFFVYVPLKLLSQKHFSDQNALNIVCRPGSARTHQEAYSAPQTPYLDFKGPTSNGRGGEGKGREGEEEVGERRGEYASLA